MQWKSPIWNHRLSNTAKGKFLCHLIRTVAMMCSCNPPSGENLFQARNCRILSLLTEVKGLRKEIGQLFEVNKQLPIPFGLRKVLQETFQCCICQSTMTPPIIFGRCCKSLIGCQSCVDRWFQGDTGLMQQTCPKCRAERVYAETCVIKGIDGFLVAIQPLVQPEPQRWRQLN